MGKLLIGFVLLNALLFSAETQLGPLPIGFYRLGKSVVAYVSEDPPPPNATYITLEEFESWFNPNLSQNWRQPRNPIILEEPTLSFCPLTGTWLTPQQPTPVADDRRAALTVDPTIKNIAAYTPRKAAIDAWGIGNIRGLYRAQLEAEGYRSLDEVTTAMKDPRKGHDLCMRYKLGVWLGRSGLAAAQEGYIGRGVLWIFKPYSDFWDPTITGYSLTGFSYLTYDDLIENMQNEGFDNNYIKEAFMRGLLRACGYAWVPWEDRGEYKHFTNIPEYLFPSKQAYEGAWLNRFYCWGIYDPTWILRDGHVDIFVYGLPSIQYFAENKFGYQVMRGNRNIPLIIHYPIFERLSWEDREAIGNIYLLFTTEGIGDLKPTHQGTLKYSEYYAKLQGEFSNLSADRLRFAAEVYTTQFYVKDIQTRMEKIDATWAKRYPFRLRPLPWHKKLEELGLDLDDVHPSPIMTLFKRFVAGEALVVKAAANLPMSEDEVKQFKTSMRNQFAQELGAYVKRHKNFFHEWDVEYYCTFIEKAGLKALADEIRREATPTAPTPKQWNMIPMTVNFQRTDYTAIMGRINATLTALRELQPATLGKLDIFDYLQITTTEAKKLGEKWLQTCKAPDMALAMLGTDYRQLDGLCIGTTLVNETTSIDNAMILATIIGFLLLVSLRKKCLARSSSCFVAGRYGASSSGASRSDGTYFGVGSTWFNSVKRLQFRCVRG